MRKAENPQPLKNTVSLIMRFHLTEAVTVVLMFSTVVLTLCPDAYCGRPRRRSVESWTEARCGAELRVETINGATFQGDLLSKSGNSLVLRQGGSGLQTIPLGDVTRVFHVKRTTGTGILIGSVVGTGIGCLAAKVWYDTEKKRHADEWLWIPAVEIGAIVAVGTLVGGVLGGIIGHNAQSLGPVQLETLPTCTSPSGDIIPIKVSFAISF
jgi:hypothetical protein